MTSAPPAALGQIEALLARERRRAEEKAAALVAAYPEDARARLLFAAALSVRQDYGAAPARRERQRSWTVRRGRGRSGEVVVFRSRNAGHHVEDDGPGLRLRLAHRGAARVDVRRCGVRRVRSRARCLKSSDNAQARRHSQTRYCFKNSMPFHSWSAASTPGMSRASNSAPSAVRLAKNSPPPVGPT